MAGTLIETQDITKSVDKNILKTSISSKGAMQQIKQKTHSTVTKNVTN